MRFERGRSARSTIRSASETPVQEPGFLLQLPFTLCHNNLERDVLFFDAHFIKLLQLRGRAPTKFGRSLSGKLSTNRSPKSRINLISSFIGLSPAGIQELFLYATAESKLTETHDNFHDIFLRDEVIHTVLAANPILNSKSSE